MRISRVSVKDLFGLFDHEIPLNLEERMTIIHGPNGFGKTGLLTVLSNVFSPRYAAVQGVPFSRFEVDFDDGSALAVSKKASDDSVVFAYRKGKKTQKFTLPKRPPVRLTPGLRREIESAVPGLEYIGRNNWIHGSDQLSTADVVARFGDMLELLPAEENSGEPDWFRALREAVCLRFIETKRLLKFSFSRKQKLYYEGAAVEPAVNLYSRQIARMVREKLAEYATLAQTLDRSFPHRLLAADRKSPVIARKELAERFSRLEGKLSRLVDAGLLDKGREMDFGVLEKMNENSRHVLCVYVQDVEQKLAVFDDLAERIYLLLELANDKFLYKKMTLNHKDGFLFTSPEGRNIPLSCLSSGEQHELVLLYELLFKIAPDSLILIDEPELSLHVYWQQQFMRDLQKVTSLARFDMLIATHSPQIINDRWDLTVELKGPSLDERTH